MSSTANRRTNRRALVDENKRFREALERIAGEQKVYTGHGDYDILPALDADEAQALARSVLGGVCDVPRPRER